MCGRFKLTSAHHLVEHAFGIGLEGLDCAALPRFNIAPSQDILAVAIGKDGSRKAIPMRWGLVPSWSKDGKPKGSTINARIETALTSAMYRDSLRRWRCLIPADGFYEWQPIAGAGRAGRKPPKQPYSITREDGQLFAFAALYSVWRARDGDPWQLTCSILTEPARGAVAEIHARMPVILHPSRWETWIDRNLKDAAAARELLLSDSSPLRTQRVSSLVSSPDNDGPELLIPVT